MLALALQRVLFFVLACFCHFTRAVYGNFDAVVPFDTAIALPPVTIERIRKRRFGLYSYYDTVSNSSDTDTLIDFINRYNVGFVNQYSCMSYTPGQFAVFVEAVTARTNATVHVLFDDTLSVSKSNCGIKCRRGRSTGQGWCCGSIDLKFKCKYSRRRDSLLSCVKFMTLTQDPLASVHIQGLPMCSRVYTTRRCSTASILTSKVSPTTTTWTCFPRCGAAGTR